MLVKVSTGNNNNKFYEITLGNDGTVNKRWGRVGAKGQTGSERTGERGYDRLIREKTRRGYTLVNGVGTLTPSGAAPAPSVLADVARRKIAADQTDNELSRLIGSWCQANRHAISLRSDGKINVAESGAVETALGPVSPANVQHARTLLAQLNAGGRLNTRKLDEYLTLIPQKVGARRGWESKFEDPDEIARQSEFLDELDGATALSAASTSEADADFRYTLKRLDSGDRRYGALRRFYEKTSNSVHASSGRKMTGVWTVRSTAPDGWDTVAETLGNIERLWHGTSAANLVSVFHRGLIVPSNSGTIQLTGRMFGDGVYFAPQSSKALNYSTGWWQRNASSDPAFMLAADVAMGKTYQATGTGPGRSRSGGYNSLYAKGGGRAGVMNDEVVIWDTSQFRIKYLCRFE